MKVCIKTSIAGARYAYGPGDIAEVDEAEAMRLIRAGIAEPVEEKPETATAKRKPRRATKG